MTQKTQWFSMAWEGDYGGPAGPWTSVDEAMKEYDRWFRRTGWEQNVRANSLRFVGPFDTREEAENATLETTKVIKVLF